MIEVHIKTDGVDIGRIEIHRIENHEDGTADYIVKYAVERGSAVSVHDRNLNFFPRKKFNVFALVLQALNALNEKDLKLERDFSIDLSEAPVSPTVARRLSGTMREIQARFGGLHHH